MQAAGKDFLREKKIIVTGALGFIGINLVRYLLQDHGVREIICIDDLSSSALTPEEAHTLAWNGDPRCIIYQEDAAVALKELQISEYDSDYLFHLACFVGPVGVIKHGGYILPKTVEMIQAIYQYAHRKGTKVCLFSSSEVYGGGNRGSCSVDSACIVSPTVSARLEYQLAKLSVDVQAVNLAKKGDIHITVIRPFNIAGPYQSAKGGFVLPRFIGQALTNADLSIYGTGQQRRAFTHVDDLVRQTVDVAYTKPSGTIQNIGNPKNITTIAELAKCVLRKTNSSSDLIFIDPVSLHGVDFFEAFEKWPSTDGDLSDFNSWKTIDEIVDDALRVIAGASPDLFRRLTGHQKITTHF